MADIANIVEQLGKLTVLETADLVKQLESAWGVTAAAPMMAAPAGAPAGAAAAPAAEAEKTLDFIFASGAAEKKIAGIKSFREVKKGFWLAETKKLVEEG